MVSPVISEKVILMINKKSKKLFSYLGRRGFLLNTSILETGCHLKNNKLLVS